MSEFRFCKFTQEWTLFAPERLKRPISFNTQHTLRKDEQECPFDMGKESHTPNEIARIEQKGHWQCRVVPNLYNALSIDLTPSSSRDHYFEKMSGFGAHEIIIETPNHDHQIWDYDYNEFVNYLSIIQKRVESLKKDKRLAYLSIFKNQGENAGASLYHSHTQIMALPYISSQLNNLIEYKKAYYEKHNRALLDDIVYEEKLYGKNIIIENADFIVFCPYASQYAFQVKIVAKKRLSSLMEFEANDIASLSDILHEFYKKFHRALGEVSFNMMIKNAPYRDYSTKTKEYYRFYIDIIPRIYKIAGFELDSNIHINVMMPDKAAKTYKEGY
ncbi:MAG: DUF4921 family protein [Campylobacterales bacterium]|nr:DUF4921 family protein [Campylobacterales bacterium]